MARESAGAVYVTIDADSSPLLAKYAQAEAQSRAAGQRIAAGLGSGLQAASGIVDRFGRSISTGLTQPAAQATPVLNETAAAVRGIGHAAGESVPEIAAASGAIRVLEGNMPIRAVERFATSVLGLGPILQAAFPLVGAIALGEMVFHVAEKFTKVSEEEKKASDAAKEFGQQIIAIKAEIETLDLKAFSDMFGKTAGDAKKAVDFDAQILEMNTRILFIKKQIADQNRAIAEGGRAVNPGTNNRQVAFGPGEVKNARAELLTFTHELDKAELDREAILKRQRDAFLDANKSQQADDKKGTELAKQNLDAARTAFKEKYDNQLADLKAAHEVTRAEELKFRQQELADARSRGAGFAPVATEVNRQVGTLSQEVRKENSEGERKLALAQVEYASELRKRAIKELEDDGRLMNAATEKITKEQEEQARKIAQIANIRDRAGRETLRAGDVIASGEATAQRIKLQADYEAQIVHSRQQQIQYARDLAAIDEKEAQRKLDAANADVDSARAAYGENQSAAQLLQLQTALTAQLKAQNDLENQQAAAAAKIAAATRGTLGNAGLAQIKNTFSKAGLEDAATQFSNDVGNGVAEAILGHHPGKSIGQELAQTFVDALRNVGKNLISGLISGGLQLGFGLLGFADGGRPPVGTPSIVGERGPELFIPDVAGTIIPSVPRAASVAGIGSALLTASMVTHSSNRALSIGAIHLHGISNAEQFARQLPNVLKSRAPNFSPATR